MQADRELRASLLTELNESGFPQDSADQLARWDPYDQNDVSPWFDQKYMFGVSDGFDVVIGNPPYISLQRNSKLGKLYMPVGYSTYTPSGDVYQLFYERGCELLRRGGSLAYITSNSWLRADYGKSLREFLTSSSTPLQLLDVGKDVFEANVDTSILILQNQPNGNIKSFEGVDVDRFDDDIFPPPQKYWGQIRPRCGDTWRILTDIEWGILEKMQEKGKPLKDWKGISIYMGIKTGYNKAFIVDTSTRESLIDEDYRSAEILKPVLRGRDILRYRANWDRRWLIAAHNGYGDIPPVDIGKYPAIKNHLDQFYEKLSKRQDQGNTPYNLRNCAYHGSFSQEKLFLPQLAHQGRCVLVDQSAVFCINNASIITGESLRFLCAILNSQFITWFVRRTAKHWGDAGAKWLRTTIRTIPVPVPSNAVNESFARQVNRNHEANAPSSGRKDTRWIDQVDCMVYSLYGCSTTKLSAVDDKTFYGCRFPRVSW